MQSAFDYYLLHGVAPPVTDVPLQNPSQTDTRSFQQYDRSNPVAKMQINAVSEAIRQAATDPYYAFLKDDPAAQERILKKVSTAMTDPFIGMALPAKGTPKLPEVLGAKAVNPVSQLVEGSAATAPKSLTDRFAPFMEDVGDMNTQRVLRDHFGEGLDQPGLEFIDWVDRNRNKSVIHPNAKTGFSMDFSTTCPKKGCGTGSCAYCYVGHGREGKALRDAGDRDLAAFWMSGKKEVENPYRGEIAMMPESLVNELNRDGGMRTFSFGDFRPGIDDANMAGALADAAKKGLYLKAITKEPELVKRFGDHPNLRINFSIDNLPRDISRAEAIETAYALRQQYPNLRVRAVALNPEEARMFAADPNVDVVTLYHGPTGEALFKIVQAQNPELVKTVGEQRLREELSRWVSMKPNGNVSVNGGKPVPDKGLQATVKAARQKICCQGGHCSKDPAKCGFGLGALLPGVFFYGNEEKTAN